MEKNDKYKKLSESTKGLTLLYVEDNVGLQKQASKIFEKFFSNVILAQDGVQGLELFELHNPDIIVTDVKMPRMSGLEMVERIREVNLDVQVIITSAFDDKENLLKAIDVGINKYLKKPMSIDILTDALLEIVKRLIHDKNSKMFNHYIHDVFEHQDNMLILVEKNEPIIANKKALSFFSQKNIEEFQSFFKNIGSLLLNHNNFLYNQEYTEWLNVIQTNVGKLFNVKIADKDGKSRHFILKAYPVPNKENFFILSFDDITELNLLAIYDKDAIKNEDKASEKKTIINLLDIIKRNQAQIKLYNSYKGLNISNTGVLIDREEDKLIVKTTFLQQRAIAINNYCIIESEVFPKAMMCDLSSINYENQQVNLENLVFIDSKPSELKHVRVLPEATHKISMFHDQRRLTVDATILNISVKGVKISLDAVPPQFTVKDEFRLNIVLDDGKVPLIVDLEAYLYHLRDNRLNFEAIFKFKDEVKSQKLLVNYISKRQMALIREFKGLKYGK